MKMLFVGSDRFFAEGLKFLVDYIYKESVALRIVNQFQDDCFLLGLSGECYDFIVVDVMTVHPDFFRNLHRYSYESRGDPIYFFDSLISNLPIFSDRLMKHATIMSKESSVSLLKKQFSALSYNGGKQSIQVFLAESFRNNSIEKLITSYELSIIKLLSSGETVKQMSACLNRKEKTLYQNIYRIKKKVGVNSKHEFFKLLTLFQFEDDLLL
ncbi:helix-turn-helix transcriptional regulator [Serratia odorifera]|nr:LuxR C-terminal-related transcriptional regulator [Serratia odorifera]PNK90718.1 hypothetical protein CEQ31_014010 [Serratia odorifera]